MNWLLIPLYDLSNASILFIYLEITRQFRVFVVNVIIFLGKKRFLWYVPIICILL